MNRRQFNQSMVALAAVTALPAVARLTATTAESQCLERPPRIGLVSVGGADGNTVAAIAQGLPGLTRTIAIDTDAFALMSSGADRKVLIGNGAHRPMHPRQACEMGRRRVEKMEAAIADLDLLIVIAGLRGAAGKGLTPVLAEIAKRRGVGMFCIAITPAPWQGMDANPRMRNPISQLRRAGATVFPINSDGMAQIHGKAAPSVIHSAKHLCAIIGHALDPAQTVCVDTDDLRIVLEPGGIGAMGFGSANDTGLIESALEKAIAHPLLGMDRLLTASGILMNVRGPTDLKVREFFAAVRAIRGQLTLDPWMLYSASVDKSVGDKVTVSILATVPEAAEDAVV